MSIRRVVCLALTGAAYIGLASPAFAWDARYHPGHAMAHYSASTYWTSTHPLSTVRTVGAPIATQTRAKVLYVAPVIPTLLGVRPAPVGQPVIYVIDQPGEQAPLPQALHRESGTANGEIQESGPRVLRIAP